MYTDVNIILSRVQSRNQISANLVETYHSECPHGVSGRLYSLSQTLYLCVNLSHQSILFIPDPSGVVRVVCGL